MAKTAQEYLKEMQLEQVAKNKLLPGRSDADVSALKAKVAAAQAAKTNSDYMTDFYTNLRPNSDVTYRNAASTLGDEKRNTAFMDSLRYGNDISLLQGQLNRATGAGTTGAGTSGAGGMSDAELKAEANKREAYDLARGAVGRVTDDPVDKLIRDQLAGVVSGKNVPFNDEVRNAMFSEQADMGGAANASRAEKILSAANERGLNPNDPGVQAALRNSLTTQQLGAQGARQDIAKTANLQNFAAQQTGSRDLANVNNSYQGRIAGAEGRLGNMLWTERFNQQSQMPGMAQTPGLPSFSQYNKRSGGGSTGFSGFQMPQTQPKSGMIDFSNTDWAQGKAQKKRKSQQQIQEDEDWNAFDEYYGAPAAATWNGQPSGLSQMSPIQDNQYGDGSESDTMITDPQYGYVQKKRK